MSHDYNPEWDYDLDNSPPKDVVEAVRVVLERLADVFSELGLDRPQIHFVKGLKRYLAKYINGTRNEPVVVVDARVTKKTAARCGVSLYDGVESTIMHEIGHAYLDAALEEDAHPDDEEEVVEHFAKLIWEGYVEDAIEELKR